MKTTIYVVSIAICLCFGSRAAETVAYWQFDDGAAPDASASLITETNAPTLNGTAGVSGSVIYPAFDNDRPAPRIYANLTGPLLNTTNSASLLFVNSGLPGNTNSASGGGGHRSRQCVVARLKYYG